MSGDGPIERPTVVVVGSRRTREALADLLTAWGWPVLAMAGDDLAGVALARRLGADLLIVDGSGHGVFGDLDLARVALAPCAVVRVVDRPQDLTADADAVLAGVPPEQLRRAMVRALDRFTRTTGGDREVVDV